MPTFRYHRHPVVVELLVEMVVLVDSVRKPYLEKSLHEMDLRNLIVGVVHFLVVSVPPKD